MLFLKGAVMDVFDLHCDTLYQATIQNSGIDNKKYKFNFEEYKKSEKWIQCMAMWIPDDKEDIPKCYHDKPLIDFFIAGAEKFYSECKRLNVPVLNNKNGDKGFVLTLENSSILENKLENIDYLEKYGVKIATLTWNNHNSIGDGVRSESQKGATPFGKKVIEEYIKKGIAIDTSHTSDALFYDIASMNPTKILATHSNSRSICRNKRNLTDEEFCYIKDKGGVVGLNFYKFFLTDDGNSGIKDILNHAYHFLSLGGEDTLAIGSDFDGADLPDDIIGSIDLQIIYNSFLENRFPKSVVDKIFYENAHNFYHNI